MVMGRGESGNGAGFSNLLVPTGSGGGSAAPSWLCKGPKEPLEVRPLPCWPASQFHSLPLPVQHRHHPPPSQLQHWNSSSSFSLVGLLSLSFLPLLTASLPHRGRELREGAGGRRRMSLQCWMALKGWVRVGGHGRQLALGR